MGQKRRRKTRPDAKSPAASSRRQSSPHDALFKLTFSNADLARSALEHVLPAEVRAQLELGTLEVVSGSFVDDTFRYSHTDWLYAARIRGQKNAKAFVYVLHEHHSTFVAFVALRLLRYEVNIWEAWARKHPGKRLPVIIPVVLSHVEGGWRAAPEFAPLLDASPEWLAAAAPYVPQFRLSPPPRTYPHEAHEPSPAGRGRVENKR